MKHINRMFEAYSAEQSKAVADKAAELLEHYKSLEVATANQLQEFLRRSQARLRVKEEAG